MTSSRCLGFARSRGRKRAVQGRKRAVQGRSARGGYVHRENAPSQVDRATLTLVVDLSFVRAAQTCPDMSRQVQTSPDMSRARNPSVGRRSPRRRRPPPAASLARAHNTRTCSRMAPKERGPGKGGSRMVAKHRGGFKKRTSIATRHRVPRCVSRTPTGAARSHAPT
jgi:hypothetical protein